MADNEEDIDNLDEDIEEELDKIEDEDKATPIKQKARPANRPTSKSAELSERYVAHYQPERTVIIDTVKEEIIVEGFKDIGTATVAARMLNNQERLLTNAGA